MRKIAAFIASTGLALGLTACGGGSDDAGGGSASAADHSTVQGVIEDINCVRTAKPKVPGWAQAKVNDVQNCWIESGTRVTVAQYEGTPTAKSMHSLMATLNYTVLPIGHDIHLITKDWRAISEVAPRLGLEDKLAN